MHVDNFLGNIFVSCDRGCNFRLSIERIYMQDFVHLHVHTQYSLLDGQASVSRLVDKAMKDGMKGIAVTDHGNMFGIKEFTNYVNKKNSGPKGEIKDLKKRIAGIESGEIECEDKEAEIADCRAKMAEAESKLFKPIVGCEIPAVLVDVQRLGAACGGIGVSQGDYEEVVHGGGNGDSQCIVLTPASVQEEVDLVQEAYDLAEKYRNPVIVMTDAIIGQMMESKSVER